MAQLQVNFIKHILLPYKNMFSISITIDGTDYTDTTVTLIFGATISTQMAIVSLVDDNVVEDTEFINLALTSVENAVMFSPVTARIEIKDTDSELRHEKMCAKFYTTWYTFFIDTVVRA